MAPDGVEGATTLVASEAETARASESGARVEQLTLDQVPAFMAEQIRRDPDRAIREFAGQLDRMAADGILTHEKVKWHKAGTRAVTLSNRMQDFLQMDMNFDGVLTTTEIRRFNVGRAASSYRLSAEIMLVEADRDGDGALSHDEIRGAVVRENDAKNASRRSSHRVLDLMVFDMDGNGQVTVSEIVKAVRHLAP